MSIYTELAAIERAAVFALMQNLQLLRMNGGGIK